MTFRNPLTSLSADDITPGTLTGSVVQTALAGRRVVMRDAPTPEVAFYSGAEVEAAAGTVHADVTPMGGGVLRVKAPLTADRSATLELTGNGPLSVGAGSRAALLADEITLGIDGSMRLLPDFGGWQVNDPMNVNELTIGGVPAGWAGRRESISTNDTTGMITVSHGLGYTPTLIQTCVTREGCATDAIAQLADIIVWSKTATQITFRVRRIDTNAWFLNNLVGFFWIAK